MKRLLTLITLALTLCVYGQKSIETDANAKSFWGNLANIPTAPLDAATKASLRTVIGLPSEVKAANFTAVDLGNYVATATLTVTDPTPTEGARFSVFVTNGTATIGGTAYSVAGTIVHRVYRSASWTNYSYQVGGGAITSDSITDATSNSSLNPGKVLKTDGSGNLILNYLAADGITDVAGTGAVLLPYGFDSDSSGPWVPPGSGSGTLDSTAGAQAKADAAQAAAIQRANHTGTQAISTVTNLQATFNKTQTDVAFIGDSITEQNDGFEPIMAIGRRVVTAGFPNWTAYHLFGRIRLLPRQETYSSANFGASGFQIHTIRGTAINNYTVRPINEILGTDSMLANLMSRVAQKRVLIVDLTGANDLIDTVTYTAAQVALKRRCLWEEMIVCGVAPTDITAIALLPYNNSTRTTFGDAINAINQADAAALGINWMPYPAVFKSAGAPAASYYRGDNAHPNKIGAFLLGQALAAVLSPRITSDRLELPVSSSGRWISSNPYMTGTQAVSGTRYTGNLATGGWSVNGTPPVGNSAVFSKFTDSEGEWQRFVVTGSDRDGSAGIIQTLAGTVTPGTGYRLVARVRSTGFYNYSIDNIVDNNVHSQVNAIGPDLVATNPLDLPAFDGVIYSPICVAPGGYGMTNFRITTQGQGTMDIRQVGIIIDNEADVITPNVAEGSIIGRGWFTQTALPNYDCTILGGVFIAYSQSVPDATTCPGRIYTFVRVDPDVCTWTIDPAGSQTINGAATFVFAAPSQWQRLRIQSNGLNWIIIGQ